MRKVGNRKRFSLQHETRLSRALADQPTSLHSELILIKTRRNEIKADLCRHKRFNSKREKQFSASDATANFLEFLFALSWIINCIIG